MRSKNTGLITTSYTMRDLMRESPKDGIEAQELLSHPRSGPLNQQRSITDSQFKDLLQSLAKVESTEESAIKVRPPQPSTQLADGRRPRDYAKMVDRKIKLRIAHHSKKDKIIPTDHLQRMAASTYAMQSAKDSAKGDLSATTVYIDLLSYLPLTVPSYKTPAKTAKTEKAYQIPVWRHLSSQATFSFYQLASAEIESTSSYALVPFTLNLSQHLWKAAEASKLSDVTYLQHLIQKRLKSALKRPVDFFFAYELAANAGHTGKPHLHGSILATASELKPIRAVLHNINGIVSKDYKRHAVRFTGGKRKRSIEKLGALYTNLNWASYCMKERGVVRSQYLIGQQTYSATLNIAKAATVYHALCRDVDYQL